MLSEAHRQRGTKSGTRFPYVKRAAILRPPPRLLRARASARARSVLLPEVSRAWPQRFFGLDEVLHVALEIHLLVGRLRQRRRRRRFVRRNPDVAVVLEPGAGRDEPAHRDVLLQAAQVIDLAGDRRLRQDAGGFLERRRRNERISGERRLRDPEQERPPLRR